LLLPGELAKHAVSEGTKAVTKYTSAKWSYRNDVIGPFQGHHTNVRAVSFCLLASPYFLGTVLTVIQSCI
jgi:hypothetical protein